MYVISGIYSGRKIKSPDDKDVRPTSGRTKEAVFNMLMHTFIDADGVPLIKGARTADICCGSGALGIEALSRGAGHVSFIDHTKRHLDIVRHNITTIAGVNAPADFLNADCKTLPQTQQPYDVIFVDPPYGNGIQNTCLLSLEKRGWLHNGTLVIVETDKSDDPIFTDQWTIIRERMYGKTRVTMAMYGEKGKTFLNSQTADNDDAESNNTETDGNAFSGNGDAAI